MTDLERAQKIDLITLEVWLIQNKWFPVDDREGEQWYEYWGTEDLVNEHVSFPMDKDASDFSKLIIEGLQVIEVEQCKSVSDLLTELEPNMPLFKEIKKDDNQ